MMADRMGARRASLRTLLLASTALVFASGASFVAPAYADNFNNGNGNAAPAPNFHFDPGTLVISASTYDRTQGPLAHLTAGVTTLAGSDTATSTAVAGNLYPEVWDNDNADGSFGVTSPIVLLDVDATNGHVIHFGEVPTNQVVTSFSSKSELSLHFVNDWPHSRVILVGYASPGVGAIDASASVAVPNQDPTDPVSFAFGANYAFMRTIVSVDKDGQILYTPTTAYGEDNGRGALLGSNGLYYAVGNSNSGAAATFGSTCLNPPDLTTGTSNCTSPDVTETTGVEVVNPIDALFLPTSLSTATLEGNSAEINPLLQFHCGKNGALDKAGKDNNYRGITEFGGALYFTKGSGSNGFDTVYTASMPSLPTVAQASGAMISIVPGFPNDCARTSGGNFTPFGLFFANATTMYVADEGSGNATDASLHAGLTKWSLVDGTWEFDYALQNGLVGDAYGPLQGTDGPYPEAGGPITTTGLRNLAGSVGTDGTVTLWATTSTTSSSGDNGADPNKVVRIVDQLSATTAAEVTGESFVTIDGPTYGTVYRGVAFAPLPNQP